MDEAWGDLGLGKGDEGEGDGELEAAGAGAPGVEVGNAISGFDLGLVRVAADDHGDAGSFGVHVEVVDGVNEVEEVAGQLNDFGLGEQGAGAEEVDVAADGGDRSNLAENVENGWVADVTGVEDVVDTCEGSNGFRPE